MYFLTLANDARKMFLKKYIYTVNHKRIGLNYLYFSMWTGCSGALLATMIRFEMAYPGSPFFKGDALRYLQVMTAHALIMIFFVVVPIFFGGFANFLLPYHVGSKDVAFPRLNSMGFWIQPCGYLLIAKIGFIRQQYWHYYDKSNNYFPMETSEKFNSFIDDELKYYNTVDADISFDYMPKLPHRLTMEGFKEEVKENKFFAPITDAEVAAIDTLEEDLSNNTTPLSVDNTTAYLTDQKELSDKLPNTLNYLFSSRQPQLSALDQSTSMFIDQISFTNKLVRNDFFYSSKLWGLYGKTTELSDDWFSEYSNNVLSSRLHFWRSAVIMHGNYECTYYFFKTLVTPRYYLAPISSFIHQPNNYFFKKKEPLSSFFLSRSADKSKWMHDLEGAKLQNPTSKYSLGHKGYFAPAEASEDSIMSSLKIVTNQKNGIESGLIFPSQTNFTENVDLATQVPLLLPLKLFLWQQIFRYPETLWYLASRSSSGRRRKRHIAKCSNATQTVAGWTFITPFSSNIKFTGVGVQDMLITGVYFAGISSTISLTNLLVTRRTLSMPGLRSRRILLPFTSITVLLMLRALAIITPVLGSAMLMLLLDRHWRTAFFDFSYGGDPILFHHLFWFFGHPEVYVLVIPAFGVINVILPHNNTRRVASKHHLVWAIYVMNYMGFLVWGHHMYLIGLDHRSRALYSTITIMISMPATIKVVNWTFSLVNGALKVDAATYASISFIFFFLVAGFTGMWLSHVSLNISMHDTMYVVAHFHLMLSGSVVMSIFAGFYYYFPALFGIKYSRTWAYAHLIYYTGGQWLTFLPLFWVAFSGLPRRLHDFPAMYTGWQSMATVGHLITMSGVFCFYYMLYDSSKEKRVSIPVSLMIPRLNKRVLYYFHKLAFFKVIKEKFSNLPNKASRLFIINNSVSNYENEDVKVTVC